MNTMQAAAALLQIKDQVPAGSYTGPELARLVGAQGPHAGAVIRMALRLGYIRNTGDKARDPDSRNMVGVYLVEREDPIDIYAIHREGYQRGLHEERGKCKDALRMQQEELQAAHAAALDIYRSNVDDTEDATHRLTIGAWALGIVLLLVLVAGFARERHTRQAMEEQRRQHEAEARAWAEIRPVEFSDGMPDELTRVEVLCRAYVDSGSWRSAEDGRIINGVKGWR